MSKKVLAPILVGAMLLMSMGTAVAATEINLYGASAQYLFWNAAAASFLTANGCSNVLQAEDASGKNGITTGDACSGFAGSPDVIIRYASKASYDGIWAMKGVDPSNQCPSDGPTYRLMADEGNTNWGTGVVNGTKCVEVTLGNSDVAGESFVQESHGQKLGHLGGGWIDRSYNEIDASGLDYYNPLVVPFGFFLNNSVTIKRCTYPDPAEPTDAHKAISRWGHVCYDPADTGNSDDCIGYYKCVSGLCTGGVNNGNACATANDCPDVVVGNTVCQDMPLDDISRNMAVMIFSGQAYYWDDFGGFFPNSDIVACFRHAGSGTHATLDWAVMRGRDWGWPMTINESTSAPYAYFNDGSSDMMKCIDQLAGAIGYADADQLAGSKNFENVHAAKYNGVYPTREMIRNGWYDFWSAQWSYEDPARADYATTHPIVVSLIAYASNPNNIPASKAAYWATQDEMVWMKTSDKTYPTYQGANLPQTP